MKIEYKNKFSDSLLFQITHQFLSPAIQIFNFLFVILITFHAIFYTEEDVLHAIIAGGIIYCALWIAQSFFIIIFEFSQRSKSFLTKHIVEIQDEAFYEETKYNRSYFFWNGITKIVRQPGFIGVYVSPNQAHVIPNRAFSSKQQISSFINLCKEKMNAAKQSNS